MKYQTLDSGREGEHYWSIRLSIKNNGSLNQRGCITVQDNSIRRREDAFFYKFIKSPCQCLLCNEIDPTVLMNHHVFGRKKNEESITICANCHERLHFYYGRNHYRWA